LVVYQNAFWLSYYHGLSCTVRVHKVLFLF
jgi:hypothetical protein